MSEKLYRAVLAISDAGLKFFGRYKQGALNRLETKKWDGVFKGKDEYIYTSEKGIKLNLHRKSKLTELILFYDFEKDELVFVERFLRKNDYFLDIGANIGLFSLNASLLVGDAGKVFCFEPTPSTFARLSTNIKLNRFLNITALNMGCSDAPGRMFINESEGHDAWNTFADVKQMDADMAKMFSKKTEVEVVKVDDFLRDNKVDTEKISLVKIDVEGWEKFVLTGIKDLFSGANAPAVMMEFTEKNTWAAGYMCQDLYDIMVSFGYEWYTYDSTNNKLIPEPRRFQYPYNNLIGLKTGSVHSNRISIDRNAAK